MFSMTPNMLCPKCFRNGNLADVCPDCGTETFSAGRNMRFPRKSAKNKWKRLLKSTDDDSAYVALKVAEYNKNPCKTWYTQQHKKISKEKLRAKRQARRIALLMQKRRRLHVKINGLVTITKENQLSWSLADPDKKPWILVSITGGGFCETKAIYCGRKILRRVKIQYMGEFYDVDEFCENSSEFIYTVMDNKMKLSKDLKKRLAIEIKNWSNEVTK